MSGGEDLQYIPEWIQAEIDARAAQHRAQRRAAFAIAAMLLASFLGAAWSLAR